MFSDDPWGYVFHDIHLQWNLLNYESYDILCYDFHYNCQIRKMHTTFSVFFHRQKFGKYTFDVIKVTNSRGNWMPIIPYTKIFRKVVESANVIILVSIKKCLRRQYRWQICSFRLDWCKLILPFLYRWRQNNLPMFRH